MILMAAVTRIFSFTPNGTYVQRGKAAELASFSESGETSATFLGLAVSLEDREQSAKLKRNKGEG